MAEKKKASSKKTTASKATKTAAKKAPAKKVTKTTKATSKKTPLKKEVAKKEVVKETKVVDTYEAKLNLEKVNNNVDYVITHTPSTKTLNELVGILTSCGEEIPYFLQKKILPSQSSDMLDFIHKKVKFKHWFCGHLHIDENVGKVSILYNDTIIKIN